MIDEYEEKLMRRARNRARRSELRYELGKLARTLVELLIVLVVTFTVVFAIVLSSWSLVALAFGFAGPTLLRSVVVSFVFSIALIAGRVMARM